ncbi:MAG: hypothetical protein ACE361_11235 [Aureliella sp.]
MSGSLQALTCLGQPCLGQTRVIYEWLRLKQLTEWWHWAGLIVTCVAIVAYIFYWYRKDTVESMRPTGWALTACRLGVFLGLLLFFLQLEKSSEQRIVRDSRIAVLIDSSMSMSLPGTPFESGIESEISRSAETERFFAANQVWETIRQKHEVNVYRFDEQARPSLVYSAPKLGTEAGSNNSDASEAESPGLIELSNLRSWSVAVLSTLAVGAAFWIVALFAQILGYKDWYGGSWLLAFGVALMLLALAFGGYAIVPATEFTLTEIRTGQLGDVGETAPAEAEEDATKEINWANELAPRGSQSRLGDALKSVLQREASYPLAGIVLLTDGRGNAGLSARDVLPLAQAERIPIFTVGIGSAAQQKNLELVEVDVPKRLYPGDRFSVKALIAGSGFAGKTVSVQILSGSEGQDESQLQIEDEQEIDLPEDGSVAQIDFQLSPKAIGTWKYAARVVPVSGELRTEDNVKSASVDVIERKNRILVLAGGPSREYQFVRNLFYRDRDVESHVFLQSGSPQSSQEAQLLLDEFPTSLRELSEYDCVFAFDADWTDIPESGVQALERWVAEQAGGFVMIAGSVEMPKWLARSANRAKADSLISLSPVVLNRRGSALTATGRIEGETAWPLNVTPDGQVAEFLWVTDEVTSSLNLWGDFEGIYSYYSAFELKPAAKALLTFSDPSAASDGQPPIYLASQYYGAGRSVFIGGSELWRIRGMGDEYFDRLYTKLARWASQGRLLLDSDRGVLLVDREKALLGDQIQLRAVLKDERFEPLVQSEVVARLIDPQGMNTPIVLRPLADGSQPGVYTGQFPILRAGEYTAQLQLGGLASDEILSTTVTAKVPALEMQRAERDDVLLRQLAVESGGKYWIGVDSVTTLGPTNEDSSEAATDLPSLLLPQDQVAYLPGTNDQEFQLRWHGWLMIWIACCLTMEWLTRRLHRLA